VSVDLSERSNDLCGEKLTVVHQETRRLVVAVPTLQSLVLRAVAVFLVHESTGDGASASVHVLVSTPAGKVDIPIVQLQLDISCCVSKIPADEDSARVSVCSDCGNVKQLAAVILDAGKEDQSQFVSMLVDERCYPLGRDDVVVVWLDFEHRFCWVEAVEFDLRLDCVLQKLLVQETRLCEVHRLT